MGKLKEIDPNRGVAQAQELIARQIGQYRRWATITLDASVLLNLYSYGEQTRQQFLWILDQLQDSIWLPHQAAFEYRKNREKSIQKHIKFSETLRDELSRLSQNLDSGKLKKGHPRVGTQRQYPFLPISEIADRLSAVTADIETELQLSEREFERFIDDDPVQEHLDRIIKDRIGDPLTAAEQEDIYEAGRKRYDLRIPPGFEDAAKPGAGKYGDLVLWHQLLDHARETGRSVIFVTDDAKADWWLLSNGNPTTVRPELVREMKERTSQQFLLYLSAEFYDWAGKRAGRRTSKAAISEARNLAMMTSGLNMDFFRDAITQAAGMSGVFRETVRAATDFAPAFKDTVAEMGRLLTFFGQSYKLANENLARALASAVVSNPLRYIKDAEAEEGEKRE